VARIVGIFGKIAETESRLFCWRGPNVIEGDMEKLREIFTFVCFAMGIAALILCVFQGWVGNSGSAKSLGAAFVACALFVFFSQIKTFKVWEVQVELREQLDQAQAFIAQLRTISVNSARSTYSQIAWGNRFGTPTAKDKQSQLDAIDAQLVGLKVPPNEIADIQRPFVKMVTLDFFFLFQGVLGQYAALINSKLVDDVHHATDPSAASAIVMKHSDLITAWTKRTQKENPAAELDKESLENLLNDVVPKSGEWLTDKELGVIQRFKLEIVRLNADCEKKGGYTTEAATYYDRYSGDNNIERARQLRNEVLQ
jgi:hypothetical protein